MEYNESIERNELGIAKYLIVAGALLGCVGWGMNFYERFSQYNLHGYFTSSVASASESKPESQLENKIAAVPASGHASAIASLDKKIH